MYIRIFQNRITTVCSWQGGVWKTFESVYIIHFIFDSSGCVYTFRIRHTSFFANGTRHIYKYKCTLIYICMCTHERTCVSAHVYIYTYVIGDGGKRISVKFKNQIPDAEIIR